MSVAQPGPQVFADGFPHLLRWLLLTGSYQLLVVAATMDAVTMVYLA